jgi:NAD(P)-dependent dehydrogenase (short-subunit alcohol dehydrogenase family)
VSPLLLDRTVAVVVGVGPGLGRATALGLATHGAAVVLNARSSDAIGQLQDEIRSAGGTAAAIAGDVTKPGDCVALIDRTVETFGQIDTLVYNAFAHGAPMPVASANLAAWQRLIDVNLWGAVNVIQAVLPHMERRRAGAIIIVSAMTIRRASAGRAGYAASKAALTQLARNLAVEVGPQGIRVNAVAPGYIAGGRTAEVLEGRGEPASSEERSRLERVVSETPLRRIPTPVEIAGSIVFFASDLSAPITGQCLDVNGGHYMHT